MTVLEALAILEAATLECKKRNVNTPEVGDALDLLEPYIWPKWLVLQFRMALCRGGDGKFDLEDQQELLRATFPGIRDSVRVLFEVRMDALARKFHETHDMKVKDELERLAREYDRLGEPWVFRAS